MAVASLTRFTVPLASDASASSQGLLMPKLPFRFRASFEGFGVSSNRVELTKQVVSFARPTVTFGDVEVHVYNSVVKLAGKPSWGDIQVVLRDDAAGNVTKLVGEQLQKQFDFMEQSSAASGIDYKFITRCEMLDGGNGVNEPTVLETWELYGCYIQNAAYGDLNYSSTTEPVQITLTLKFDNAVQTPGGVGIGTFIGRTIGQNITM
jgi:hypothetical protein